MVEHYAERGVLLSAQSLKDHLKFSGKSMVMSRIRELAAQGYLDCVPYRQDPADTAAKPKFGKVRVEPTPMFLQAVQGQLQPKPTKIESSDDFMGVAAVDPPLVRRPMAGANVRLGFPSPAEDFVDAELDLNELLGTNQPSVFFYRARGDSMVDAGIFDGDILVVDRSITASPGDIVLAYWESNNAVCKIYRPKEDRIELHSAAPGFAPIVPSGDAQVEVYVVTSSIKQFGRRQNDSRPR